MIKNQFAVIGTLSLPLSLAVSLAACGVVEVPEEETSTVAQAGTQMQGTQMQGTQMQGTQMQGTQMQGFSLGEATIAGTGLTNLRVERGELVAQQGLATLRGTQLIGARLEALAHRVSQSPPIPVTIEYRITNITPESWTYDPTHTGSTFLYTLEQWDPDSGTWQYACQADSDGRRAAIPLTGTWNSQGDRVESTTHFTFGCTTGVIAKCYRWGYRPWLGTYGGGDMVALHQSCTRAARADYCGDGTSHTFDGTPINIWDNLTSPGPIQRHGLLPPLGMIFEAGWGPDGAVCMSHARWITLGWLLASLCPDRLIPLGLGGLACDSVLDVLDTDPDVRLFTESYLSLSL